MMIDIPAHILRNALRLSEIEGVDALCSWWDSRVPAPRQGAEHFGIYIGEHYGQSIWHEDRTVRSFGEMMTEGSSAMFGRNVLFEFRKTVVEDKLSIAYDMIDQPISSYLLRDAAPTIWRDEAARDLRVLNYNFGISKKHASLASST